MTLQTLAAGLNDPSSGTVANGRVYFIESKYGLLFGHKDDEAGIQELEGLTADCLQFPQRHLPERHRPHREPVHSMTRGSDEVPVETARTGHARFRPGR